MAGFCGDET